MDALEASHKWIKDQLDSLNKYLEDYIGDNGSSQNSELQQTHNIIEAVVGDKDKNLDKILEQQNQLKMIIERDIRVKSLKNAIEEDNKTIEALRKDCLRIDQKAAADRQEQLTSQTSNLEKFQIQQLKSITEDFKRHQAILEQRKNEKIKLMKEAENEEVDREGYLADVEKKLEKELRDRQQLRQGGGDAFLVSGLTNNNSERDRIELTSVDEYAPYGTATNSTTKANGGPKRGGGRARRKNKL